MSHPRKTTVFYDGTCPLCSSEIGLYRRQDAAGVLCFVDISGQDADLPKGITREQAMQRFHVQDVDGALLSGAPAFVQIWKTLPQWRWAARLAQFLPIMALLAMAYQVFLPLRPLLSRLYRNG